MIIGEVNAGCEAIINLCLIDKTGKQHEISAIVDTGFDGSLTLPASLIQKFGFPFIGRGVVILGDGKESVFRTYEGTLLWEGEAHPITIEEANIGVLVGMKLLYGYELKIEIIEGGKVFIKRL